MLSTVTGKFAIFSPLKIEGVDGKSEKLKTKENARVSNGLASRTQRDRWTQRQIDTQGTENITSSTNRGAKDRL